VIGAVQAHKVRVVRHLQQQQRQVRSAYQRRGRATLAAMMMQRVHMTAAAAARMVNLPPGGWGSPGTQSPGRKTPA
jgi:hypothetical protein